MKKFMMGLIVGVLITISTSVIAEETDVVGKVIDATMPLFIDGQQADKDLIVVDGTSYAPMRAASGYFGYDIEYIPDKKEVAMKKSVERMIDQIKIRNKGTEEFYDSLYLVYENEIAVPAASIGAETEEWDGTTMTLSLNGQTTSGTRQSKLENGDPMGVYEGRFYVKLSALGLKGSLQNGQLTIE